MEQYRAKVGEKGQEQEIREKRVRLAQHSVERRVCRENRGRCSGPYITIG